MSVTTGGGAAAAAVAPGVWERHKQNPADASLFSETAVLLFVPTAAGGRGRAEVRAFLDRVYPRAVGDAAAKPAAAPRVLSTVVGVASLVEESVFDNTLTRGHCEWICPGADLRNVVGRRVTIPMVTVVTFSGEMIESKHVYWDQASVLAQIGVLSLALIRNNNLPVLTNAEEAELVENPGSSSYNKLANVTEELSHMSVQNPRTVEGESVDILSQGTQNVQYRLSSRVLQPGGTGGKSSVFSDEPEARRTIPADPRRYETNFSFGNDPKEEQPSAPSGTRRDMNFHSQIGHDDASTDARQPVVTGKKVNPDKTNVSQFSLSGGPTQAAGECTSIAGTTGKKVNPDKTNVSQFSLNGDQCADASESTSITGARKRPGTSNQNLVSQFGLGAEDSNAPIEQKRSSRVTQPPGGGSSVTLG